MLKLSDIRSGFNVSLKILRYPDNGVLLQYPFEKNVLLCKLSLYKYVEVIVYLLSSCLLWLINK